VDVLGIKLATEEASAAQARSRRRDRTGEFSLLGRGEGSDDPRAQAHPPGSKVPPHAGKPKESREVQDDVSAAQTLEYIK